MTGGGGLVAAAPGTKLPGPYVLSLDGGDQSQRRHMLVNLRCRAMYVMYLLC